MALVGAEKRVRIRRKVQFLRENVVLRFVFGFLLWLSFIYLADRVIDESPTIQSLRRHVITVDETLKDLETFLSHLRVRMRGQKSGRTTYHRIWKIYHDLVKQMLLPWDKYYFKHMPKRRDDGSIFLSVASYRDQNCMSTLEQAFKMAKYPEKLFVGLVQQNCVRDCVSGVTENFETKVRSKTCFICLLPLLTPKMKHRHGCINQPVGPDPDCHLVFCKSEIGKPHCDHIRALHMDESESLGPYMARYFASKLWNGESWFLQIDSHTTFAKHWDVQSIQMLQKAPSDKPVLSHYPIASSVQLREVEEFPAPRICGAMFSAREFGIVRLDGDQGGVSLLLLRFAHFFFSLHFLTTGMINRKDVAEQKIEYPRFGPFVAAGYLVAHSDFLRDVPFDPLLPWIFMGEEIILSARLWTHGYDIFAPTHSVVSHAYADNLGSGYRKPKFWESMGRLYWPGIHAPLQNLVLNRVKYLLQYPECSRDFILPKTLLTEIDLYGMGNNNRTIHEYLSMVGIDPFRKVVHKIEWCEDGLPPPMQHKKIDHLYDLY